MPQLFKSRGSFCQLTLWFRKGEGTFGTQTNFSGDCPGGGGSPDRVARGLPTGGQGPKVYVLCVEPKEYKPFRPGTRPGGSGTRPGGSVTGVTEKLFMCQMFYVPFPGPNRESYSHMHAQSC